MGLAHKSPLPGAFECLSIYRMPQKPAYYCGELGLDLVLKNVDCFKEFANPLSRCSEKCASTWSAVHGALPKCSALYEEQRVDIFKSAMEMAGKLSELSHGRPVSMPKVPFKTISE